MLFFSLRHKAPLAFPQMFSLFFYSYTILSDSLSLSLSLSLFRFISLILPLVDLLVGPSVSDLSSYIVTLSTKLLHCLSLIGTKKSQDKSQLGLFNSGVEFLDFKCCSHGLRPVLTPSILFSFSPTHWHRAAKLSEAITRA
jgi:hypothetical protein